MNPYEVYMDYLALKQHFLSEKYDYFKFHGKIKTSITSFESRRDKHQFRKISKHKDPHNYLLSNLIEADKWIGEMDERCYEYWLKRTESLAYTFKEDLNKLNDDFHSNFIGPKTQLPRAIQLYFNRKIAPETFIILLDLLDLWGYYKCHPCDIVNPLSLFMQNKLRLKKYAPFLKYDRKKYRQIVIDKWQPLAENPP